MGELARLEAAAIRHRIAGETGSSVWREWGDGEPLVLIHGGFGTWRHWVRNIPLLSRTFRVLAPDIPGMGDSDPAPDPPSLDTLTGILSHGLGRLLGSTRRCCLAGFSFGAMVAGALAAEQATAVNSLLLLAPIGLSAGRPRPAGVSFRRLDGSARAAAHRANLRTLMLSDDRFVDDLAVEIQEVNNASVRVTSFEVAVTDGLRTALPRIACVPRLVWGERDNLSLGYMAENIALTRAARPDAMIQVIPGAGHWLPYERPDVVNALITEVAGDARVVSR